MKEQQKRVIEILLEDAVLWERTAEDLEYLANTIPHEPSRREALARAAWYRQHAADRRLVAERMKEEAAPDEQPALATKP
jgi:hypothetical protein